ncbi:hypothetical protein [Paenibacillus sp. JDR-2]|uniref:hypothetical protein n=1 Tax=Paenibacillus sp. (strain JDR-2) TaxID=324057 RepID=UPI0001664994|nr:hypothetical protein [Paenibacillus sp. JDR-2]ACT03636.1 hypothetical protein Pjdr2_5025 [Paenibacillus sp. JDR-2]
MKMMWCWRCRQEVPMLDEKEYRRINKIYKKCFDRVRKYRMSGSSVWIDSHSPINESFKLVAREYEKMTGYKDMHHNAIMHHRISMYGEPCPKCGKPLRTPQAKMCVACGKRVHPTG